MNESSHLPSCLSFLNGVPGSEEEDSFFCSNLLSVSPYSHSSPVMPTFFPFLFPFFFFWHLRVAFGILVPQSGIEPVSPALEA